jgi:hypothetical protein
VRLLVSLLVLALWGSSAEHCLAAPRRVAVVRGDAELGRQLSLALEAWDVETLALDVAAPAATQPEAMNEAAELAARLSLDGVVWVTEAAEGSVLWIYDALEREVTTRGVVERPPFGSATAAGLALSVKTTLRASVEPEPPISPPPPPRPAMPASVAAQREPRRTPPAAPRAQLSALLDAQSVADGSRRAWYSVHSALWFGRARRAGIGLRVGAGAAVSIQTPRLNGSFRELSLGPSLELKVASGPLLVAQVLVGASLHASTLDGTLVRDGARAEVQRYNVALDAGASLDFRLTRGVLIGLQLGAAYLLGYQRYLVEGQAVFSPSRLVPSGGAHVGFELY